MTGESRPSDYDKTVVRGLAWTAGGKWATQLIGWASVLIMARLLSPADFGLADLAGYFFGLTNVLAEFGVGFAVVQMPEMDRRVLKQLNTASVALCTLAFAASMAVAPLVAAFLRSPKLETVIMVYSIGFFVTGFQAVPQGLLARDLDYRRISVAEAVLVTTHAVVMVSCALAGLGYWSLVAGIIAGKATSAVLTFCWQPVGFGRPRWRDIAAPLRLGWHVAVSRLALAFYTEGDGIVVGRMLGQAAVGSYRLAITVASAPAEKISLLIMRVTGPLFAKIQNDKPLVRRYFLIVSESLATVVLPLTFGLAMVAPEVVRVALGPKWMASIWPLRWLALFTGIRALYSLILQVLTSQGKTSFGMWTSLFNSVVMLTAFVVAARWGTAGVAASWFLLCPLTFGPSLLKLLRTIDLTYREYFRAFAPVLSGGAGMAVAVIAMRFWLIPAGWPPALSLAIQVIAGGAVYCGVIWVLYRERIMRYVRFFQGQWAARGASVG
jgi:PST family polysaccharide transporter